MVGSLIFKYLALNGVLGGGSTSTKLHPAVVAEKARVSTLL